MKILGKSTVRSEVQCEFEQRFCISGLHLSAKYQVILFERSRKQSASIVVAPSRAYGGGRGEREKL
jgi:hypothetical protein